MKIPGTKRLLGITALLLVTQAALGRAALAKGEVRPECMRIDAVHYVENGWLGDAFSSSCIDFPPDNQFHQTSVQIDDPCKTPSRYYEQGVLEYHPFQYRDNGYDIPMYIFTMRVTQGNHPYYYTCEFPVDRNQKHPEPLNGRIYWDSGEVLKIVCKRTFNGVVPDERNNRPPWCKG